MPIDSTYKKRALFTGLQPYLKDSQLNEAMYLWECKYAQLPTFSVRHFVADVQNALAKTIDSKAAFLSVLKAMTLPEKELLPDPTPRVRAYIRHRKPMAASA